MQAGAEAAGEAGTAYASAANKVEDAGGDWQSSGIFIYYWRQLLVILTGLRGSFRLNLFY